MIDSETLKRNIEDVRKRIAAAAQKAGRKPDEIKLVAVSKTFDPELIRHAFNMGIKDFGENYVQEALEKVEGLPGEIEWHFLGHLQKNKVRKVIMKFDMIQSVDSISLLQRIDRICREEGRHIDVLLQVNTAGEQNKYGMDPLHVPRVLEAAQSLENVEVTGLMLIPPFYDNPERNRSNFAALRELSLKLDDMDFKNWESRYLSMGMTDDFETAVSEGSNMVRIGRAVFGPRRRN